ncbi:hypothetical protein L21SP2_2434 [Salinispira pacifica]|uniref:Uncharacterized protein n=1 Tax=Salinispira pacifica TaxID=1307761 RepID=V5WIX0_9SPIO|nr:hypothetical protein L21SP2_2434 [Salinispira pacifica]
MDAPPEGYDVLRSLLCGEKDYAAKQTKHCRPGAAGNQNRYELKKHNCRVTALKGIHSNGKNQ